MVFVAIAAVLFGDGGVESQVFVESAGQWSMAVQALRVVDAHLSELVTAGTVRDAFEIGVWHR